MNDGATINNQELAVLCDIVGGQNKKCLENPNAENKLGPVGIQDSHPGLVVIQALDGPLRFE
jgi:hypothetical protein